jgi:hypothetical protein
VVQRHQAALTQAAQERRSRSLQALAERQLPEPETAVRPDQSYWLPARAARRQAEQPVSAVRFLCAVG